jgi:hypothetical protein
MTPGLFAMLIGVFGVPAALLWGGHRLRRRSARWRAVFWGTLIGYAVGVCAALVASMVPAEAWSAENRVRGLLGYWSLVICSIIGALIALGADWSTLKRQENTRKLPRNG